MRRYYCCLAVLLGAIVFSFCGNRNPRPVQYSNGTEEVDLLSTTCSLYMETLDIKLQAIEQRRTGQTKQKNIHPLHLSHELWDME